MATESTSILDAIGEDSLGLLIQSSLAEQETRDNVKKQSKLLDQIGELQAQSGPAKVIVNTANQNAELSAQQNKLKVANAAGIDPSKEVDELTSVISELAATNRGTREDLRKYDAQRQKGIFNGGPLNWLSNLVEIEKTQGDVRVSTKKAEILANQVTQLNNVVQQTGITHNQIKQSVTEGSIAANNQLLLAEAQVASKQSEIESLKYNSFAINTAKEASKERLAVLYNLNSARIAEMQLSRSLDALTQSKIEFEWRKNEKDASDKAKAEGKEVDDYLLEMINIGRANRGAGQLDPRSAKTMIQIFKAGGAGSKELYIDYKNGEKTKGTGLPMLGATPSESLDALQILGTTVASVREETLGLFQQAKQIVSQNKLIDPTKKEQVDEAFNQTVKGLVKEQYRMVTPGSGNIFDPGDLRAYLGNSEDDKMGISSMKNTNIAQKFLLPAIEANQPMHDPRVVIKLAIAAVIAGQITSTDYMELADIYRRANEINLASKNLIGLGIIPPNAGKNLNIKNGSFGATLDITSYEAMNRELSIQLSRTYQLNTPVANNPLRF